MTESPITKMPITPEVASACCGGGMLSLCAAASGAIDFAGRPLPSAGSENRPGFSRPAARCLAGREWWLDGVARSETWAKCVCGRWTKWVCHLSSGQGGAVLGLRCLEQAFPSLGPGARALKFRYRALLRTACSGAKGTSGAAAPACCGCKLAPALRGDLCLGCFRGRQLAAGTRSCPKCSAKIPANRPWWRLCFACFSAERDGELLQSAASMMSPALPRDVERKPRKQAAEPAGKPT